MQLLSFSSKYTHISMASSKCTSELYDISGMFYLKYVHFQIDPSITSLNSYLNVTTLLYMRLSKTKSDKYTQSPADQISVS